MNYQLQIILTLVSIGFFIFIYKMITNYKMDLRHSLVWVLSSLVFILMSIFPGILTSISRLLHIEEPVNTIFLLVIFFLLVVTFTLTLTISKRSSSIKDLVQEVAILKLKVEELSKEQGKDKN
ncbi:DUF2304 domain-containing protein [Clostridium algidicarnis]|uniref:DUF2304 domain-containing protein n=1 Tax=Clostridium algidicarnis TaxID=37659 RepID=A0ABS6C1N5_9CLOT|nr:DUF2304 domain-containing protein [Clostridium algidicarnis]MBB6630911.1 DUF2304 domain-containing protein [Clostridium algidicarnis]MBB6696816.1 DUF2304 domain-containing protein [Clostridium algidicarnis]MBU3192763.1 DUF2304 domain-containing protein [Clostridium algidicarnis]MBU3196381.1 DUF2304 domain-containing protein [Clostridium algidicarnis]MBU3204089.1 DUF2304 domain-containing protein [Clostridium algidicarnis]